MFFSPLYIVVATTILLANKVGMLQDELYNGIRIEIPSHIFTYNWTMLSCYFDSIHKLTIVFYGIQLCNKCV